MVLKLALSAIALVLIFANLDRVKGLLGTDEKETEDPNQVLDSPNSTTIFIPNDDKAEKTKETVIIIDKSMNQNDDSSFTSTNSSNSFSESQADRISKELALTEVAPKSTAQTSLAGSQTKESLDLPTPQIKRDSSFQGSNITDLEEKIETGKVANSSFNQRVLAEQKKAEAIRDALFGVGNFANPNF